ncbi:MAG TPA: DUF501 domain-containing protein [Actinomycetota bacterium]|nr:DUF501 domain-containing protein [Actinomycetota bacterium]
MDARVLEHTEDDRAVVERQLGRPVRGRWTVARRCHLGVPMVIESHPRMPDGTPFPTLFWLTCPVLVKRASQLESAGALADATARLASDVEARRRLAAAVGRYRARRDALEPLPRDAAPPGGGPERVKCLHAHVAHELADPPNPVGGDVLARAGWPDCRARCVEAGGRS